MGVGEAQGQKIGSDDVNSMGLVSRLWLIQDRYTVRADREAR